MNQEQAQEALRYMLGVHVEEDVRYERINRATSVPTDAELADKFGIDFGSRNYDRHMRMARQSYNPLLELMLDTYGQSLKVDNYFRTNEETGGEESVRSWQWWQRNQMDARQTGLHHSALKYGLAYASALPGDMKKHLVAGIGRLDATHDSLGRVDDKAVAIGAFSPRRLTTLYGEGFDQSEYPMLALQHTRNGFRLYDEEYVYFFGCENRPEFSSWWTDTLYNNVINLPYLEKRRHGVGVVPIIRYRDKVMLDGEESNGMVESLIGMAERVNNTNYQESVSRHFSAFKQRYIIGWMPKDEREAMAQKVSDTWFFKDSKQDVSVGQFGETDLSQYVDSRKAMEAEFAANAQLPATIMGANVISNVSAEGLAALERGKELKASELQVSLGESHEQLFRLCAHIAEDEDGASDYEAEVKWRDTSARTLSQAVDALGKLATQLGIPVEELWSEIPGWTHQQVERAKQAKQKNQMFSFDPAASLDGVAVGGTSAQLSSGGGAGGGGSADAVPDYLRPTRQKASSTANRARILRDGDGDGIVGEN